MRGRSELRRIARRAMLERGLLPEFSPAVLAEVRQLTGPARSEDPAVRDLVSLPWCSIDNDDSRDLDQLTVAEPLPGGAARVRVAVADVDALVKRRSAIDAHAATNTTSVYTGIAVYPMLPPELSTDLTSLNEGQDRLALVMQYDVASDGTVSSSELYRARVHNHARLTYNGVAAWLDENGAAPAALAGVPGLAEALHLQDRVAQALKRRRHEQGALELETIEARPVFDGEELRELRVERKNRARALIEDFMIAANGVTARFLRERGYASFRRVIRSPKRWGRIIDVAAEHGVKLPNEPDSGALEEFLVARRRIDPLRFPDLSLVIVKLMGKGEYVVEHPDSTPIGHFGLAVRDYTHSTAPNRRFPDLVTHRLVKAALAREGSGRGGQGASGGRGAPYDPGELDELARHCTEQEDDASKVERQVRKSAAALLLEPHVGELFDGIVTGAADKGTWARLFSPPVEGRIVEGQEGLDVGERVRVRLLGTDVERGFIDFARA